METNQSKEYTGPYRHIEELIDFLKSNGIDLSNHEENNEIKNWWNEWKENQACDTEACPGIESACLDA